MGNRLGLNKGFIKTRGYICLDYPHKGEGQRHTMDLSQFYYVEESN